MNFEVAGKAGLRFAAGINDEFPPASPGRDVLARRTMAGLAAGVARHVRRLHMQSRMNASREGPRIIGMAIHARGVADEVSSFNVRRRNDASLKRGA
jgi:hypothetical protein